MDNMIELVVEFELHMDNGTQQSFSFFGSLFQFVCVFDGSHIFDDKYLFFELSPSKLIINVMGKL